MIYEKAVQDEHKDFMEAELMGYFSNGSEGADWESDNCSECVHESDCAALRAHKVHNYKECNNPDSILHLLIPYKDGVNGECRMRYVK